MIIKLAAPAPGGGPSSAASTLAESDAAVLPDTARAIDPALQLYKVEVPEGQTAAEVAAALAQSNGERRRRRCRDGRALVCDQIGRQLSSALPPFLCSRGVCLCR